MSFFRQNFVIVSGLSATFIFGSSLAYLIYRLNALHREIRELTLIIVKLNDEVGRLQEKIAIRKKRRLQGFYSVTASSGDDDDDIYQDAYGGSDLESLRELTGEYVHLTETSIDSGIAAKDIFDQTEELFEGSAEDKQMAYELLIHNRSKICECEDFYWRLSKAAYLLAEVYEERGEAERKKQLLFEATENAATSLNLYDSNPDSHKWYAITLGSLSDYKTVQEKIKNGFLIRDHIQRAIDLNPLDSSNHYMLGRWCYSVYMLSWLERRVAATLYASPPTASIDDALTHFLQADKIKPGEWKENSLFIAKCYIELRQYNKAKEWLLSASKIAIKDPSDKKAQVEIDQLKVKYG